MELQKIGIIGSGNVAFHLASAFLENNCTIEWVYSRNEATGSELANKCDTKFIDSLNNISEVDLVLVCIKDDGINVVLNQLPSNINIAYTSGTFGLYDSQASHQNLGVFYPLQTFKKESKVDIFEVPFLIEAKNDYFKQQLFDLAWKLSKNVHFTTSEMRMHLHLAAVMLNNFANHLAVLAKQHLDAHNLNWELLYPLIKETNKKILEGQPEKTQTGPAIRGDYSSIEKHLNALEGDVNSVYKSLTNSILNLYGHKKL